MSWIFELLGDSLRPDTISSMATAHLLVHLTLKSTVVLLIALLVTKVAIKRSAAARHLVWMVSFVAIAVTLLLPGIWPSQPMHIGSLVAGNDVFDPTAFDEPGKLPDFMVQRFQQSETEASFVPVLGDRGQIAGSAAGNTHETEGQIGSRNRAPATFAWGQQIQTLAPILLAAWIVGTTGFLSLLVIGHLAMQRRQRGFHRATDRRLLTVVKRTRRELEIKRDVTLYQSDDEAIPMTWGVFSPSVWLPTSAQDWSNDRLRMVLLHELAHVRRFDCLWQAIALVSLAVHWFNPLVWLAAMRMRTGLRRCRVVIGRSLCELRSRAVGHKHFWSSWSSGDVLRASDDPITQTNQPRGGDCGYEPKPKSGLWSNTDDQRDSHACGDCDGDLVNECNAGSSRGGRCGSGAGFRDEGARRITPARSES